MELTTDLEKDLYQRLEALRIFAERYTSHGTKRYLLKIHYGKVKYDQKKDELIIKE